jgi:single-stranded DNA-binding protein
VYAQYSKKGQRIMAEGEVDASAWMNSKDGSARTALELTATTVRFLSAREEQSEGRGKELPSGDEDIERGILF